MHAPLTPPRRRVQGLSLWMQVDPGKSLRHCIDSSAQEPTLDKQQKKQAELKNVSVVVKKIFKAFTIFLVITSTKLISLMIAMTRDLVFFRASASCKQAMKTRRRIATDVLTSGA